jgi:hypothetical protein
MRRRELFRAAFASATVIPAAAAQEIAGRSSGLPTLTIKDVRIISIGGGRNYRWVFIKAITNEPGLDGVGTANNNYETKAVSAGWLDRDWWAQPLVDQRQAPAYACHAPPACHVRLLWLSVKTGFANCAMSISTSRSLGVSDSNWRRRRNPRHCCALISSGRKPSVSANGISVGTGVRRRSNMASAGGDVEHWAT